ncbi:unnamed protein product [Didymodactylos carnosus]|uniref:tRNA-binding domain-containing protein n=1 Tax=Didymodactylos carnosus TaxID=1234261 RepID=A0A8S2EZH7_9BILA|nr:unnamed protein product [Didymodactylos carnosus]CAF4101345.1 unnamed protein product [Didymodactylos carnosus]
MTHHPYYLHDMNHSGDIKADQLKELILSSTQLNLFSAFQYTRAQYFYMDSIEQKAALADDRIKKLESLIDSIETLDPNAYIEVLQEENDRLKIRIQKLLQETVTLEQQQGVTQYYDFIHTLPKTNLNSTHQHKEKIGSVVASSETVTSSETKNEPKPLNTSVSATNENVSDAGKKSKKKGKDETKKDQEKAKVPVNTATDITRFDLRVGKIVSVEKHPDADSLYVETIDIGEEKPRTVCSGLVKHMSPDDLHQKLVIVLCNLKPAKMRGIFSEAMVMCASTPDKVELLEPPSASSPGDRVVCEGYNCSSPDQQIKKELCDLILPEMKTNTNLEATFKNVVWQIENGKGTIKSKTLENAPIK